MRIALLSWESLHSIAVGGIAAHVSELSAAMAGMGHDVHVFTRIADGQGEDEVVDGVHYHRCGHPPHDDFIEEVNGMCGELVRRVYATEDAGGRFDVVHAHDWLTANAMIWIKQDRGRETTLTFHSTEFGRCGNQFTDGASERIREQERAGAYWADRIIAVSEACKREILWMYEAPDWKVTVIHNGVDPTRFDFEVDQGEVKRHYQIGPLDPTILFCGRLVHQKGPDVLMEAVPGVLDRSPRTKFVFVGDGHLRGHLERRAHELGVTDSVRILGNREASKVAKLFKMADAVCVPSRNEPFGIVVLEAWSAGKPVVATHNGGPGEFVYHGINGLKVDPDPGSVAEGIHALQGDFEHARAMGADGRRAIDTGFNWRQISSETLSVYDPERAADAANQTVGRPAEELSPIAAGVSSEENGHADPSEEAAPTDDAAVVDEGVPIESAGREMIPDAERGRPDEPSRTAAPVAAKLAVPAVSESLLSGPRGLLADVPVVLRSEQGALTIAGTFDAVWNAAKRCYEHLRQQRLANGHMFIEMGATHPPDRGPRKDESREAWQSHAEADAGREEVALEPSLTPAEAPIACADTVDASSDEGPPVDRSAGWLTRPRPPGRVSSGGEPLRIRSGHRGAPRAAARSPPRIG